MTIKELRKALLEQRPMVIAIDGPSGSGKSTLTDQLETQFDAMVFHADDYFLPSERKTKERLAEPGGNVDRERMIKEIFDHIYDPFITSHHYNCHIEAMEVRTPRRRKPIIIIEGVYSMHPIFQPYYDVMIYLKVDRETQLERILKRSNQDILERFKKEWIPLEDLYFQSFSIPDKADISEKSTIILRDLLGEDVL